MMTNPKFESRAAKTARRGEQIRTTVAALVDDAAGSAGITFQERRGGGIVIAIHDGHGTDGQFAGIAVSRSKLEELIEKLTCQLDDPSCVPEIADAIRRAVWPLQHKVHELAGEAQVLRWRVMHLEREAAENRPPVRISEYSDTTALVVVPTTALAVREERAA